MLDCACIIVGMIYFVAFIILYVKYSDQETRLWYSCKTRTKNS